MAAATTDSPTRTEPASSTRLFGLTLAAVAAASLTLPFSVTGTAIALPSMSAHLGSSIGGTQWIQNAFNLTFASMALASGSLADRFGRRRVLLAGIATFAVAGLLVALTTSILLIDIERAVQGAGAAAVLASGAAVLAHGSEGRRRRLAFSVLGTAFGAGLALGPLAAGALVTAFGWRSPFLATSAVAAVAWICATRVRESRNPATLPVDIAGLFTFTGGLACVSLMFVEATTAGWTSPFTVTVLVAAVGLLTGFVVVESRDIERAMFDIRLFKRPDFVAIVCQPFAVTLGFVVFLAYLPPYLQGVTGRSVLESGLLLLPMTVPVLIMPIVGSMIAARTSLRTVLAAASLCNAAGAFGLLTLHAGTGWLQLAGPLLLTGVGVGLAFGVMDNAAISTVPLENAGAAAGIFNTMRLAGEAVAIAGAAAVLTTWTAAHLPAGASRSTTATAGHAVQGDIRRADLVPVSQALTSALHVVAIVLGVTALLGAALSYLALRPANPHPTD